VPSDYRLLCGMALGYPDEKAPVNRFRPKRAPLGEFLIPPKV
jgi:nitroreductase